MASFTIPDYVLERLTLRAQAEGKTVEDAANEALRWGLIELQRERPVEGLRDYRCEFDIATSDEEAIQIAVDAVHEVRAEDAKRRIDSGEPGA
jgi:plasmid stability protein